MALYRHTAPQGSVTPKMHMIENHMIHWVRRYQVGLGLHGEQGAESIHARINCLLRTYSSIRKPLDRLKGVVLEHNRSVCPAVAESRPLAKKRKT